MVSDYYKEKALELAIGVFNSNRLGHYSSGGFITSSKLDVEPIIELAKKFEEYLRG